MKMTSQETNSLQLKKLFNDACCLFESYIDFNHQYMIQFQKLKTRGEILFDDKTTTPQAQDNNFIDDSVSLDSNEAFRAEIKELMDKTPPEASQQSHYIDIDLTDSLDYESRNFNDNANALDEQNMPCTSQSFNETNSRR